jgi:hypothetical protein
MEPSNDNIYAAFVKAQAAFPPIPRNKKVTVRSAKGNYEYYYADLADIMAAVNPHLHANGLAVSWRGFDAPDGVVKLEAVLKHVSMTEFSSGPVTMAAGQGPQGVGSSTSYAKRYSVCMLLGLATDEDDDAAIAQGLGGKSKVTPKVNPKAKPGQAGSMTPPPSDQDEPPAPPPPPKEPPAETVSGAQLKTFFTLLTRKGYAKEDLKAWLASQGVEAASSKDIPAGMSNAILQWIEGLEPKEAQNG